MRAFRIGGTSNEITQCELCGKPDLTGTVQMIELDVDGNDIVDHYYGTSCAAKAATWTVKEIKDGIRKMETAKREAEAAASQDSFNKSQEVLNSRCIEEFGTADIDQLWKIARSRGMGLPRLLDSIGC